jgi:hypothetical protein
MFTLLLGTYMPVVVFLVQHGVSLPSVSAIRDHWLPIRKRLSVVYLKPSLQSLACLRPLFAKPFDFVRQLDLAGWQNRHQ